MEANKLHGLSEEDEQLLENIKRQLFKKYNALMLEEVRTKQDLIAKATKEIIGK